jgi:SNF2 family DNA or RNA helicase
MKALYEYFQDDFSEEAPKGVRSAVELAEFQEDAVKKARKILMRYDGVMVADSVGLGKTWIGKKLLEDFAYHLRQKALIICPAALREMWERELKDASIAGAILSQEALGRDEFDPSPYTNVDVILVDESHNFRNRASRRYQNIEMVLGANGGRGRYGARKKIILLTATPINNDLFDLYNQLCLITRGDQGYFSACGIGDLRRYFAKVRRDSREGSSAVALFNLLEEIVIRRTRPFIRHAYPEATIQGKKIHFPERKLKTIQYDLESTYSGIYGAVVSGIESLRLAPYNLESYKKEGVEIDEFEAGREQALVGIFKSRYLKRFESSIEAFRISIRRALAFIKTFESYVLDGKLLRSGEFHKALRFIEREGEEDDAIPKSLADEMDESAEARIVLESMESIDHVKFDLRKLHEALQQDVDALTGIWNRIKDIAPEKDMKLQCLKGLLSNDLKGKKVLVFSYYKDTVRYLYQNLGNPDNPKAAEFVKELGDVTIRRMDSGVAPKDKARLVQGFAPHANGKEEWAGTDKEINIMISSDVLSEGQNLQDCGHLINYDLHWNPTRMVQRAGRIDRIGTDFDTLWIYNIFPDEGLERLLGLVERLTQKISNIDRAGFLDASVLGEAVNPRNFNTLKRILEEDGSVIEEEEQFTELASNEFLKQQLQGLLDAGGKEMLDSLPDGIHSGLIRPGAKGVFFYFRAEKSSQDNFHFWKYFDLKENKVIDNRYVIANLIACDKDTPRVVEPQIFKSVFDLQEKVIEDILRSYHDKKSLEAAPRTVDPIQQTVSTIIQGYINHPDVERKKAIEIIRYLNQPMLYVQTKELRLLYNDFKNNGRIKELIGSISMIKEKYGVEYENKKSGSGQPILLTRSSLKLICFDVIS